MKRFKRMLALILSLTMVTTSLTVTALAEGEVCSVTIGDNTTQYATFEAAWNAANVAGRTAEIKLLDDALWHDYVKAVANKITIDLNGHVLQDAADSTKRLLCVNEGKEVDIIDTSEDGNGQLVANGFTNNAVYAAIVLYGTFKALGGTIKTTSTKANAWLNEDVICVWASTAKAVIDGATIDAGGRFNTTNAAIGVHAGSFEFKSGEILGCVLNYSNNKSITGNFTAKTQATGNANSCLHTTFEDAWLLRNRSGKSSTITLLDDAVWHDALTSAATKITIDLNGHILQDATDSTKRLLNVAAGTEIDITDNSANGDGQLISNANTNNGKNAAIIVYGTFKALGGTIKTSSTNAKAWLEEDVICGYSGSPTIVVDGGNISTACATKPAIGARAGSFKFLSGTIEGGVLNYNGGAIIEGDMVADACITGKKSPTYFTSIEDAKRMIQVIDAPLVYSVSTDKEDPSTWRADIVASVTHDGQIYYANDLVWAAARTTNLTTDASSAEIKVLADCDVSSYLDFYNSYSESINRTIGLDLNGKKLTFSSASSDMFGMAKIGKLIISDSVGGAEVDANGRYLVYTPGYTSVIEIHGGTYTNLSAIKGKYVNQSQLKLFGGTYDKDPSTWIQEGCEVVDNLNGTWTVKEASAKKITFVEGQTAVADPIEAPAGSTIILPAGPNKDGFFAFWETTVEEQTVKYSPGDRFTVIGDQVFNLVYDKAEAFVTVGDEVTYYRTLKEAAEAAVEATPSKGNAAKISLNRDAYIDNTLVLGTDEVSRVLTFDFNGYTLSTGVINGKGSWANNGILRNNPYAITYIIDSSPNKTGRVEMAEGSLYYVLSRNYVGTKMYIQGGTWTGASTNIAYYASNSYCQIQGGTFDIDPDKEGRSYVASGYRSKANGDGTWTVSVLVPYAEVTIGDITTSDLTFAEAFELANVAGQEATIKLFGNLVWPGTLTTVADKIILDLNGYTLQDEAEANKRLLDVTAGTEFIVTDSASGGQLIANGSPKSNNGAIRVKGTFKALGGTIKTTATAADAWSNEDVFCTADKKALLVIDGATITAGCNSKPAIGLYNGEVQYISGAVNGGILNHDDAYTVTGDMAVRTQKKDETDAIYYTSFNDARLSTIYRTKASVTIDFRMLADASVSSRINFMTEWNEESPASRIVKFDLNGYKLTATEKLSAMFGINSSGSIQIYDNAGGGVVDACGSPLICAYGYGGNGYIYGGTFIDSTGIGNNYTSAYCIRVYGGTFSFDVSNNVYSSDYNAYDNGDDTWTVKHKVYLVHLGDDATYYAYINEAVDAILASPSKTGTITPIEDITLDDTLVLDDRDARVTLNLGGFTVAPAKNKAFADLVDGSLFIENGEIDFTGTNEDAYIRVAKGKTLELNEITFTGSDVFVVSNGSVLIDGILTVDGYVIQEASDVSFYEVQASLSDEIKFSFVVNGALIGDDAAKSIKLQYSVDTMFDGAPGRETVVLNPDEIIDNQYTFYFTKGLPQWSTDSDLELKLLVDDVVALEKSYTLQDYYNLLYTYYPDNTILNTLTANQLNFAKQLQVRAFGESTIKFAGWEDDFISIAIPTEDDNVKDSVNTDGYEKGVAQIAAATVNVTDKIALTYKIYYPNDGAKLTVVNASGEEVSVADGEVKVSNPEKPWYAYQDKISPIDYKTTYTVSLAHKGKTIHAVTYSVNSYCYSMINGGSANAETQEMALALYRYGVAASAYAKEYDPAAEHHYGAPKYEWTPYHLECTASRVCLDPECGHIVSETAKATRTDGKDVEGLYDEEYLMTVRFANPMFRTQVVKCYPDAKAIIPKEQQSEKVVYDKNLILNADGSYGGTLDASKYGEGTPANGALDDPDSPYYTINDYYNLKSSATRVILPQFKSYQQTMQYSDGIACVLMALNYMGEDVAETYTEEKLVQKYEEVNDTTVYGNGTTAEGLSNLLNNIPIAYKYTVKVNDYTTSQTYSKWVKANIEAGNIIMAYYHLDRQERWMAIIGYDDMGTSATGDDIYIYANPFDVNDHYQDGYFSYGSLTTWMCAVDLAGNTTREYETVVIVPNSPKTLEYDYDSDPVKCYPSMGERHLLLNPDGSWGGTYDETYGGGGTQNGMVLYEGEGYKSREHFEYNYYAYPDVYNMETDASKGRYVLTHFNTFEQTMTSSCGISSMLNTLNYLGYDFTQMGDVIKDIMEEHDVTRESLKVPTDYDRLVNLTNMEADYYSKVQEGIVAIFAEKKSGFSSGGKYLNDSGLKLFNNYGGVGASSLAEVPKRLGYTGVKYSCYYRNGFSQSKMPFPTYDSFLTFAIKNLSEGRPIIFCGPNHWRTVIGIDTMGTDNPYDDVILIADSSDGWDHFQNGIDTEPAVAWYAHWYNGGRGTNQQYVLVK